MNKPTEGFEPRKSQNEVEFSIKLDSEIFEQLQLLTNNPSKTIETALKHWLQGERHIDSDLTRTFRRNPPVPPRGEWND